MDMPASIHMDALLSSAASPAHFRRPAEDLLPRHPPRTIALPMPHVDGERDPLWSHTPHALRMQLEMPR